MNFQQWINEADIPMQDKDGNWYDAETGFSFGSTKKSKVVEPYVEVVKHEFDKLTIKQLKELVAKRIAGVQYSLNKGYANEQLNAMALNVIEISSITLNSKQKNPYFDLLDEIKNLANAVNRAKPSQN